MKRIIAWTITGSVLMLNGPAYSDVLNSSKYTDPKTGVTIHSGQLTLPLDGVWLLGSPIPDPDDLSQLQIEIPVSAHESLAGLRAGQMKEQETLNENRNSIRSVYWQVTSFARKYVGNGPKNIEELWDGKNTYFDNIAKSGMCFLVPEAKIYKSLNPRLFENETQVLLFELKPAIADGKHWVVLHNGRVERREIDPTLLTRYKVAITPGQKPFAERFKDRPKTVTYTLYGQAKPETKESIRITVSNWVTHAEMEADWDLSKSESTTNNLLHQWAQLRMHEWVAVNQVRDAPLLNHWSARSPNLYGVEKPTPNQNNRRRRRNNNNRSTTMFSMLGGRAAVRETLQMQPLLLQDREDGAERKIPIASIKGVEVKSHPFAEMLGDEEGGRLEMANWIPVDRFFLYFAQPHSVLKFLDGGADFIFNSGVAVTGRRVEYGLEEAYFKKLGLSEKWVRSFLKGGSVKEMALILPDLFLIDGSDMTTVIRLKNPKLAGVALKVLGLKGLDEVAVKKNRNKEEVYWAQRGEWLMLSSHRGELDRVLARFENDGKDSLGRSAEFRYMLTQLPIEKDTQMFAYFSDPFIRHLVSPRTKIAQFRRLVARTELEGVNAGTLLNRLDGLADGKNLEVLTSKGYVPERVEAVDTRIAPKGFAVSDTYGTIENLTTLLNNPIENVTQREADGYKNYLDNYNRFWRRFFDPIAIRIDSPSENEYSLNTFILPLIDNSIYDSVRRVISTAETGAPPTSPVLDPMPVAQFSVQFNEGAWLEWMRGMSSFWSKNFGLHQGLLDRLQPELHLAVADADPIISMGSGEFSNMFGSNRAGMDGMEMVAISMFVSLLTRPVGVFVKVDDPEKTVDLLRNTRSYTGERGGLWELGTSSFYKISGKDKWILNLSLEGFLNMSFSVEVKGDYLVLHNMPMSGGFEVTGTRKGLQTGLNLTMNPAGCIKQLPALHASAMGKQREAAMAGIAYLQPMLDSGFRKVRHAEEAHKQFFGFTPLHPMTGEWRLHEGRLRSSEYGSPTKQQQPAYKPGDRDFGMLNRVDRLRLGMQFEQDGLRATVEWKLRGKK